MKGFKKSKRGGLFKGVSLILAIGVNCFTKFIGMRLHSFNITNFKIDGGAMFGVVPKILWEKHYPADENNFCNWSLRSLVIDTGDRVVLIDNGFGNKQSEKFFSRFHLNNYKGLEEGLAEGGYKPEDVTDMVLTHLHTDHCGGGVKTTEDGNGYKMTFPNARYFVSKDQWEWAVNPNMREKDTYLPENLHPMEESGQLHLIEEEREICPGVSLRLFNGHTRGQIIPFISYNGRTIVFAADLLPSTVHIPLPYIMSYDVMPLETLKEKELFLKEALDNGYVLFFQHDYYNECCNLQDTHKGIRAKDTFLLQQWLREI